MNKLKIPFNFSYFSISENREIEIKGNFLLKKNSPLSILEINNNRFDFFIELDGQIFDIENILEKITNFTEKEILNYLIEENKKNPDFLFKQEYQNRFGNEEKDENKIREIVNYLYITGKYERKIKTIFYKNIYNFQREFFRIKENIKEDNQIIFNDDIFTTFFIYSSSLYSSLNRNFEELAIHSLKGFLILLFESEDKNLFLNRLTFFLKKTLLKNNTFFFFYFFKRELLKNIEEIIKDYNLITKQTKLPDLLNDETFLKESLNIISDIFLFFTRGYSLTKAIVFYLFSLIERKGASCFLKEIIHMDISSILKKNECIDILMDKIGIIDKILLLIISYKRLNFISDENLSFFKEIILTLLSSERRTDFKNYFRYTIKTFIIQHIYLFNDDELKIARITRTEAIKQLLSEIKDEKIENLTYSIAKFDNNNAKIRRYEDLFLFESYTYFNRVLKYKKILKKD